ncbi:MAG: hypothetical protein R3281_00720 [Balneolaceae bacterium]|nr:hypothetical protein [Balneolaceae bacterium]
MSTFTILGLVALLGFGSPQTDEPDTTTFQQPQPYSTIKLYIDCRGCSETYIRNEINFVRFVRDMTDADVHLLVTRQFTGSGGREYKLRFIGQKQYKGREDTLFFQSYQSDTQILRRRGLVKKIKVGLIPYLMSTSVVDDLNITYNRTLEEDPGQREDKWNRWIFEVGVNTFMDAEDTRSRINVFGELEATRITKNWKTNFEFNKFYRQRKFKDDDTTETFITESNRFDGLVAKSIDDHWSVGFFTDLTTSTRNNYDLRLGGSPAIEYNIFPYSEYAEREISFRYVLLSTYNNYTELTAFGKREEFLFQNRFSANMEFTQPWGEIEGDVDAYAYLQDLSKNRLIFDLELDFQVTRGLELQLSGRYSLINDQLSVPAAELTEEEQLLDLVEPPTSFYYNASIGFEYTFGSIYSNVVNPRF